MTGKLPAPIMKTQDEYVAQIKLMAEKANAWRAANPGKSAVVQFNFPPHVQVIATISQAVKNHFVFVDEAGRELLEAMHPWNDVNEATPLMYRIALEAADEIKITK